MKIIDSNNIEVMRENIRTLAEHISEEGGDDPRVDTLVRLVGTSDLPEGKTLTALAGEHDQDIDDIQGDVVNIIDIIGEEPIEQDTLTAAIAKNAQDISAINTNIQQKTSRVFGATFTNGIARKNIEWVSHDHTALAQELCDIPGNIARLFYSAKAYDGYVEVYARDLDGNAYNGTKTVMVYITY